MSVKKAHMCEEWAACLKETLYSEPMNSLRIFLRERIKAGAEIYPEPQDYFTALNLTPPSKTKVVILGQDPYHGPGQAHGLAFSVRKGIRIPPSLHNIHKELLSDTGIEPPRHGNLEAWAKNGVLLLNTVLTVERGLAGSHKGKGWELLTDEILKTLQARKNPIIFIAWGRDAQDKVKSLGLDEKKNPVISSSHPAPLSARSGFFGSRPFSRANSLLKERGETPLDWSLPE